MTYLFTFNHIHIRAKYILFPVLPSCTQKKVILQNLHNRPPKKKLGQHSSTTIKVQATFVMLSHVFFSAMSQVALAKNTWHIINITLIISLYSWKSLNKKMEASKESFPFQTHQFVWWSQNRTPQKIAIGGMHLVPALLAPRELFRSNPCRIGCRATGHGRGGNVVTWMELPSVSKDLVETCWATHLIWMTRFTTKWIPRIPHQPI